MKQSPYKQMVLTDFDKSSIFINYALTSSLNQFNEPEIKEQCPNQKIVYSICSHCNTIFETPLSCHSRECYVCQQSRSRKFFKKYNSAVAGLTITKQKRMQFLTLTLKNVQNLELYTKKVKGRGDCLSDEEYHSAYIERSDKKLTQFIQKFRRRYKAYCKEEGLPVIDIFEFGFICKEMTYHEEGELIEDDEGIPIDVYTGDRCGYHYHYHILFYGDYIDLTNPKLNISNIWKEITGDSHHVKLYSKFNDAFHALRYILKYATKPQYDPALHKYYQVTARRRYFQPFGKRFKNTVEKTKIPFICSDCLGPFEKNKEKWNSPMFEKLPKKYLGKPIKKLNYKRLISKSITISNSTKEEKLLKRIKDIINLEENIDYVENLLDDKEIEYLLKRGAIMKSRYNEYKLGG